MRWPGHCCSQSQQEHLYKGKSLSSSSWSFLKKTARSQRCEANNHMIQGRSLPYWTVSLTVISIIHLFQPWRRRLKMVRLFARTCVRAQSCVCSVVSDSASPWTVALQPPLPMEFSRPESWSGMPFLLPGDLKTQGFEPASLVPPAFCIGRLILYH